MPEGDVARAPERGESQPNRADLEVGAAERGLHGTQASLLPSVCAGVGESGAGASVDLQAGLRPLACPLEQGLQSGIFMSIHTGPEASDPPHVMSFLAALF